MMAVTGVVGLPKQARGRERFERLLRAAAALIAEQGVEGVAFSEIARRTGTAQGSLYQYFPSKEALVTTLHAKLVDELVAVAVACRSAFLEAPAPRGLEGLMDVLLPALARFYAANPAYREIRHALPRSPAIQFAEANADRRGAEVLTSLLRDVGLDPADVVIEALIELGDALLPWAGEDPDRLGEVRAIFLSYLGGMRPVMRPMVRTHNQ